MNNTKSELPPWSIEVEGLSKSFTRNHTLVDIDLNASRGEHVTIVRPMAVVSRLNFTVILPLSRLISLVHAKRYYGVEISQSICGLNNVVFALCCYWLNNPLSFVVICYNSLTKR